MKCKKRLAGALLIVLSACQPSGPGLIANDGSLTLVSEGYEFTEGPASDSLGNVYFTDQPNNRILKWDSGTGEVSVYMEPAGRANGLYVDRQGHLVAAADEVFQLWKIDRNKQYEVLAGEYNGQKFNGPNDLWIDPEGGIYFTDPYYQRPYWERTEKEIEQERVYYLSPDKKEISIAAENLVQPNGIIGTADATTLYVADIGDNKTYAYEILGNGILGKASLFAEMGSDGMTIDDQGNLYLTGDGVTVLDPAGEKILHIPVPEEWTANVTFGGKDQRTLFITAMDALYSLPMKVKGTRF
ncbi:SMP-30/gluconolactonase/LRE family protein [Zeaxanthinibacter sp. PT1]|uniref:SMP-30/gluconolactonase/LRE family protein n=1 Tax=Zeaxanthinibacter TaxID=561554 RepID=UPI0023492202|nr:SMP-30/gluconolactonase/LRE family protein [Zeaxanthinibacter sp. PT1]MDC6352550.1 SMP-30/gluconolactonase/LRE family protein [Zeaxanthinibacter sp. PT1]